MLIISLYYYIYHKKNENTVNNNIECSVFFPTPDVEFTKNDKYPEWILNEKKI
jgi:hypothetical protein